MTKKQLKIRRLLGLKVLAAFMAAAVAPQANAGIFDYFFNQGPDETTGNHGYLTQTAYSGLTVNHQTRVDSPELKPTVVSGSFLVANASPVKYPNRNTKEIQPEIVEELIVATSAYSSTPDQTDDSPFITASGTKVRDGVVAANFLPIGAKIKIPEIFGDKIFVVEDRMNKRYQRKIDIWFPDRQSALEFGVRTLKIQILES